MSIFAFQPYKVTTGDSWSLGARALWLYAYSNLKTGHRSVDLPPNLYTCPQTRCMTFLVFVVSQEPWCGRTGEAQHLPSWCPWGSRGTSVGGSPKLIFWAVWRKFQCGQGMLLKNIFIYVSQWRVVLALNPSASTKELIDNAFCELWGRKLNGNINMPQPLGTVKYTVKL